MGDPFLDADVWGDEIPIETDFFLNPSVSVGPPRDPLFDSDPLQVNNVVSEVEVEETKYVPPLSPPPPRPRNPGNINEFIVDTGKRVNEICQEAVSLFDCDPREYHPFYLTIDESIKTGMSLGYVKPSQVNKIWVQFSKFAKQKYQERIGGNGFSGQRSKYADSLVTKTVTKDMNLIGRFGQLTKVGKQIRLTGLRATNGGDLKDDLTTRLAFFNECADMKSPELCYRMNQLWKEVLGEETEAEKKTRVPKPKRLRPKAKSKPKKETLAKTVATGTKDDVVKQEVIEDCVQQYNSTVLIPVVPKVPAPARVHIPQRERVKRRKLQIQKSPNQALTPTHLQNKREKAAMGMSRAITMMMIHQAKGKLGKDVLGEETEAEKGTTVPKPIPKRLQQVLRKATPKPTSKPEKDTVADVTKDDVVKQEVVKDFVQQYESTVLKPAPEVPTPAPPQIPLRKRVKRREFPIEKPPNQTLTPIHLLSKKKKAAMGMRRVITKVRKTDAQQVQLEMMITQPKEKFVKCVKQVKKKKIIGKTAKKAIPLEFSPGSRTSPKTPSTKVKSKPLGKSIVNKKKALAKLNQSTSKASPVPQTQPELLLSTKFNKSGNKPRPTLKEEEAPGVVKPKTNPENHPSEKIVTKVSHEPKRLTPKKSKTRVAKLVEEEVGLATAPLPPDAPPPPTESPEPKATSSIPFETVQDSSFQDDTEFSPPPASPDNNNDDDFDNVPPTEPTPTVNGPISKETEGSPPSPPDASPQPLNLTNEIFQKYHTQKLQCPLCKEGIFFHNFSVHLRQSHNHVEDLWQCPSCPRQFRRRDCWLFHVEADHNPDEATLSDLLEQARQANPKPFVKPSSGPDDSAQEKCDICDEMFNSSYLSTHKKVVHSGDHTKAMCPLCPKSFKDTNFLWYHYCINHADGTPLEAMYPVQFSKHDCRRGPNQEGNPDLSSDPKTGVATCDLCSRTFTTLGTLVRHRQKVHGIGDTFDNQWPCPTCGKTFKAKDTMDAHYKRIHEGSIKSNCPHCGRACQSSGKLWVHMVDVHRISAAEAGEHCDVDWCLCEYCGQEVLVDRQYANHVKAQHPEHYEHFLTKKVRTVRKARDGSGKGGLLDEEEARQLTRDRKNERRRRCRETGQGPNWLKTNVADSGNCPECGVYHPKALRHHRRWQHGVKPEDMGLHSCRVDGCVKSFRDQRNLMLHMRQMHTTELEERIQQRMVIKVMEKNDKMSVYECTLCGDFMCYYEEVKVHCVVKHPEMFGDLWGGDKGRVWKCRHCSMSFEMVYEMQNHVLEVHPESCWTCEKCGAATLTVDELDRHWAVEHAQEGEWFKVSRHVPNRSSVLRLAGARVSQKDRYKWESFRTTCEVCGFDRAAGQMEKHLIAVHGITEDGEGMVCLKCPVKLVYKYRSRGNWLCHMAAFHKEVSLEELRIQVGKVHTKQDWRKMSVKNSEESTQRRGGAKLPYAIVQKTKQEGTVTSAGFYAEKTKWEGMMLTCEICGAKRVARFYYLHLKGVHGVTEDQRGLKCKVCPEDNWFSFKSRASYMFHMATYHGADVEELRKEMAKIYTKQDWRTMEIKNPQGKHIRQPRKSRALPESQLKRKRRTRVNIEEKSCSNPKRKSGRNARKTKRYGWDSAEEEEEEEEEDEVSESGGDSEENEDKLIQPMTMRTRASRKRLGTDNCKENPEEIEKNRKLVISLARLRDDEILIWKRKGGGGVFQGGKQSESDYQVKIEVEESLKKSQ